MPDWVKDKQRRLATIRAARAALEAKARAEATAASGAGGGRTPALPAPKADRPAVIGQVKQARDFRHLIKALPT